MTPEELFLFDLEGYLVVKSVLTPEEVANLNAVSDRVFERDYDDPDRDSKGRSGFRTIWSSQRWKPGM